MSTATIDWCESNYAMTPYIAEFWNTLSAVLTIFPAMLWFTQRNPDGAQWFRVLHICTIIIQCGSALFHGTLTREAQLLDEVPILIWLCTSFCLVVDTFSIQSVVVEEGSIAPKKIRKGDANVVAESNSGLILSRAWWAPGPRLLALLGVLQVVMTIYLYTTNFQVYELFIGVVVAQAGLHWPIIMTELFGRLKEHSALKRLLLLHFIFGYGGFGLWTLENAFCERMKAATLSIPMFMVESTLGVGSVVEYFIGPFAEFVTRSASWKLSAQSLHLHAIWHFLAIAAMKFWHDFLVYYRLCVVGKAPLYRPGSFLGLFGSPFSVARETGVEK